MKNKQNRRSVALICILFLTFAMTSDAVGSIIARVIGELHLTLTQAGAFQYVPMAAIAFGAAALGGLADRFGRKAAIVGGLVLYGGSSLLFAFGHTFTFFVALLGLTGIGISVFKTGALALIGDLSHSGASHTALMNAAEGFFGIGSIIGPAAVAALIGAGLSWTWLYVGASVICGLLILLAGSARFPPIRIAGAADASVPGEMGRAAALGILRDPLALGFSAMLMLYVAVECAVYVWLPTYLQPYRGPARWLALYALTIFFVLRATGRFLGIWLLRHFSWHAVLAVCGLSVFGCFLGAVVGGVNVGIWLLPLSGLPMSIIYPTLNSKGISCFPRSAHGAAAGVLLFFTAVAAALGPLAIGAISDAYGDIRVGFEFAAGLALLLSLALGLNWVFDPTRQRLAGLATE
ncbi:MAG TPA: MFS transporter [Steroidobacteraceae bacterium]|nr:MFS transporter [Steroidobacteraceae bacterium]